MRKVCIVGSDVFYYLYGVWNMATDLATRQALQPYHIEPDTIDLKWICWYFDGF